MVKDLLYVGPSLRPLDEDIWLAVMGMHETLSLLGNDKETIESLKLWII